MCGSAGQRGLYSTSPSIVSPRGQFLRIGVNRSIASPTAFSQNYYKQASIGQSESAWNGLELKSPYDDQ